MFKTPVIGRKIVATFLGNYYSTIAIFLLCAFLTGLLLNALSAYPYLQGRTFPMIYLIAAINRFYPLGQGVIRACGNILCAQQYHPLLQKKQIETYYVHYYL
jgi:hypothetical protein